MEFWKDKLHQPEKGVELAELPFLEMINIDRKYECYLSKDNTHTHIHTLDHALHRK